jgi:hypothetical protein
LRRARSVSSTGIAGPVVLFWSEKHGLLQELYNNINVFNAFSESTNFFRTAGQVFPVRKERGTASAIFEKTSADTVVPERTAFGNGKILRKIFACAIFLFFSLTRRLPRYRQHFALAERPVAAAPGGNSSSPARRRKPPAENPPKIRKSGGPAGSNPAADVT